MQTRKSLPQETEKSPENVINGFLWGEKPIITLSCFEITECVEFG